MKINKFVVGHLIFLSVALSLIWILTITVTEFDAYLPLIVTVLAVHLIATITLLKIQKDKIDKHKQ